MIKNKMTEEEMQNKIRYELSKQILKRLFKDNIITIEQYEKIDKLNMKSFAPDSYQFYNYEQ